jgi:hypothetical protein
MKIYNKVGKPNYKEAKLIKEIQKAVEKKLAENPNVQATFKPANNLEELQQLHREYCTTDVEFEEIPNQEEQHKQFRDSMKEDIKPEKEIAKDLPEDNSFIDPFNDADPIVRDYVMDDGLKTQEDNSKPNSNFDEPVSFDQAFQMPTNDTPNQSSKSKDKKESKDEPLNPSYNDQSSGRKKRTNKKFAKYIVEAVCMLAERGFIWWTTNKVTEAKLAEYELNNEMDLTLLVTMPNGQEATVKQFFKSHCVQAEQLSKYEQDEKDDLAEVLAELLDKKGITPSIEQEAAIIALKMFGQKFMIGLEMNRGINNLLTQLKEMAKKDPPKRFENYEYDKAPEQEAPQQEYQQPESNKNSVVEDIEGNFGEITDLVTT